MPVSFSYLDFGIGGKRVPIGTASVDLPVRGAPGHPTFAHVKWRTPPIPGHYCLLVELIWGDDANPLNNIGQHNVNIGKLNSPNAKFEFPLRNGALVPRLFRLDADAYRIPPRPVCRDQQLAKTPEIEKQEADARLQQALARHGLGQFPVPVGWSISVVPREALLGPDEAIIVVVDVTAPDSFAGQQTINVRAIDDHGLLAGGVTLVVES